MNHTWLWALPWVKLGKVTVGIFHWSDTVATRQTALGSKDEGFPFLSLWNRERVEQKPLIGSPSAIAFLKTLLSQNYSPQLLWTLKIVPRWLESCHLVLFVALCHVFFLRSPGCPGTHCVGQADLEVRDPPTLASSAWIKGVCCHTWPSWFLPPAALLM